MSPEGRVETSGPAIQRLWWRAEAAALGAGMAVVGRARPRLRRALGSGFGAVFWAVDARHRRAACRNIALAYGDRLSPRDVRRLARDSMRHFVRVLVESAALQRSGHDEALCDVGVEGLEHLRDALGRGRGLLGFSGHFGHWDLLRLVVAYHGLPSAAVGRPLDNPYLDQRLNRFRAMGGRDAIAKRGGVASALKHLRDGEFVTLLIDQRHERSGVPVPFFGRQAFAAGSLAVLALRTGAPIVPGFGFLDHDGAWRVVVEPEVPVTRTNDIETDTQRIMTDCTAILERWIREYPEQWLWTHARLKP